MVEAYCPPMPECAAFTDDVIALAYDAPEKLEPYVKAFEFRMNARTFAAKDLG